MTLTWERSLWSSQHTWNWFLQLCGHGFYLISSPPCLKTLQEALGLDVPPNYRWLFAIFKAFPDKKRPALLFFKASGVLLFCISHCTYILKSEKVFKGVLGMATRGKLWYFWPGWEAVGGEAKGLQKRRRGWQGSRSSLGRQDPSVACMTLPTWYPGILSRLCPFLPFFVCLCLRSWITLLILQLWQQRKFPNISS